MNTLNPCQNGAAHTSLPLGGYNCSCANSGINCSDVGKISTALIPTTGIPIAVPSTAISIAAVIHSTMTTTGLVTIATTTTGLVTIAPAAMISTAPPMVSTGATNGVVSYRKTHHNHTGTYPLSSCHVMYVMFGQVVPAFLDTF